MPEKKHKIRFSLGLKFSAVISLLVLLIVIILGYILINLQTDQLVHETLKRCGFLVRSLSRMALENIPIDQEFTVIQYCTDLVKEEGVVEAFVMRTNGAIFAHSDTSKITFETKKMKRGRRRAAPEKIENEYNNEFFFRGRDLSPDTYGFQLYKNDQYFDIFSPVKMELERKTIYLGMAHIVFSRAYILKMIEEAIERIVYISVLVLILGVIGALLLTRTVTRPVKKLAAGVSIIGTGNLDFRITLKARDELGYLADNFNSMTQKLKEAQKVLLEKERMEREMQIASSIQQTLLPKKFPEFENIEYGTFYQATKSVGGDYYDLIRISGDKLGIVAADVSGKGVPGSLVMSMFRSMLRSNITPELNSFETLCRTNALLVPDIIEEMFVTVFYGIFNLKTRILDFSLAGHNPLIIFNSDTRRLNLVNAEAGIPVGLQENEVFKSILQRFDLKINKNDIIIQYTDGITEAMNPDRKLFGEERFHQAIQKNGVLPPKQFIDNLLKEVVAFTSGAPQSDDMTLVAVKIK